MVYDLPGNAGPNNLEEVKPENAQMMTGTLKMAFQERWQRTLSLWPYIVPLVVVYFAEYSMQVWYTTLWLDLTALALSLLCLAMLCRVSHFCF